MSPTSVDDLRTYLIVLEPSKSGAKQTERFSGTCRTFERGILALRKRCIHSFHVVNLQGVRLVGEINKAAVDLNLVTLRIRVKLLSV